MSFELIALTVLLTGWMICGVIPWLLFSIFTRGNAGLGMLPLSMFVAVVAALAVPVLGGTGTTGLWLSFVVALVVPGVFLGIRRFSLGAKEESERAATADVHRRRSESVE